MKMLRPSKHSHPDRTVISVSLGMLSYLKQLHFAEYDKLRGAIKKTVRGGEFFFLPALNFLYLLGLIEYHPKTDSIEYIGPHS